jgi:hypothetical protein
MGEFVEGDGVHAEEMSAEAIDNQLQAERIAGQRPQLILGVLPAHHRVRVLRRRGESGKGRSLSSLLQVDAEGKNETKLSAIDK